MDRNLSVVPDPEDRAGGTEEPWEYPAPEGVLVADDNDLGAAAQTALEGDDHPIQESLIPACKVKFQGMAWDSLEEVPNLKDEMVFLVRARIVSHEQYVDQRSGDLRDLAKAKVDSVKLFEGK